MNESGLGMVEYGEVARAVSELSDPQPAKKGNQQRADMGKYALENENERARRYFSV